MDEVVGCFVEEAHQHLESYADAVLRLEREPDAPDLVDVMFRAMHTIKGAAGFLALPGIEALSHAAEDVLSRMRSGEVRLTPGLASVLLTAGDEVRGYLADLTAAGAEQPRDVTHLLSTLAGTAAGDGAARQASAQPAGPADRADPTDPDEPVSRSVRVAAGTLDLLLEHVGELVNVRNGLSRIAAHRGDADLSRCAQELEQVAAGLRDAVRTARTQQVGTVWQALPRVVRDSALRSGKQARLVSRGADLECDRDVLDAVREPLLHMVRNAVDHGIEEPSVRIAAGKPGTGTLELRAARVGGHVSIELSDDGAGIDAAAVGARALALGVVTQEELDRMTPADVVRLVLHAGLSTASVVTSLSGRGVGMDVVRRNVEDVGGRLDIASEPGRGTTITLELPVLLGIAQVLTVAVGDQQHALAVDGVADLLRLEPADREQAVGRTVDGEILSWRGALLPLVDLDEVIGAGRTTNPDDVWHVAVVRAGTGSVGLRSDGFGDTEEVVVRPLDRALVGLVPCSGAAVLGDGTVAMLLDAFAVALAAGRIPAEVRQATGAGIEDHVASPGSDRPLMLTVSAGPGRRLGVPVDVVARVIEVPAESLEPVGSWDVLHQEGSILPVVRALADLAPGPGRGGATTQVVVVRTLDGGEVGIAVEAVEDLAPVTAAAELAEDGLDQVALVAGHLVGQLDVRRAVAELQPGSGAR